MWLYRALDKVFPTSYAAKLVLVAVVGVLLPPLAVMSFVLAEMGLNGLRTREFILYVTASAIGLSFLIPGMIALAEPVGTMGDVMQTMQKRRVFTPMPSDHRDGLGLMMSSSNEVAVSIGARLDPRVMQERTDALTGLLDGAGFEAALMRAGVGTLLRVTLDDLPAIRERYGDVVADGLVARSGRVIRGAVRKDDIVGRLGDDIFAVWLKGAGRIVSRHVAERICEQVQIKTEMDPPGVTCSVGLAVRGKGEPIDVVHGRAEGAQEQAQARGNYVEIAHLS
jgi:GGDEF domain-containing protein